MTQTPEDRARERLAEANALVRGGALGRARALLRRLGRSKMAETLGPETALGLPRKLHAVHLRLAKAEGDAMARAAWRYFMVPPERALAPLVELDATERARSVALARAPVPRILHQIWIGPAPAPASTAAWALLARRQGVEYRLWREADLAAVGIDRARAFRAMLERGDFPGAVDVARYLVLAREGGVYLDCDWYPARDDLALEDALPMVGLCALAEAVPRALATGSPFLTNALIATPPDHPVLHRLNAILPEAIATLPGAPAWWVTGPVVFTLVARTAPVALAPHGIVAGRLPRGASPEALAALRAEAKGFLIEWKSW